MFVCFFDFLEKMQAALFLAPLFVNWAINQNCSIATTQMIVVPNLPVCGNDSIVMGYKTLFENKISEFGICVCSDKQIFVGVKPHVYFEFGALDLAEFILSSACTAAYKVNYVLVN